MCQLKSTRVTGNTSSRSFFSLSGVVGGCQCWFRSVADEKNRHWWLWERNTSTSEHPRGMYTISGSRSYTYGRCTRSHYLPVDLGGLLALRKKKLRKKTLLSGKGVNGLHAALCRLFVVLSLLCANTASCSPLQVGSQGTPRCAKA